PEPRPGDLPRSRHPGHLEVPDSRGQEDRGGQGSGPGGDHGLERDGGNPEHRLSDGGARGAPDDLASPSYVLRTPSAPGGRRGGGDRGRDFRPGRGGPENFGPDRVP